MNPDVYARFKFRVFSKKEKRMIAPYYLPTPDRMNDATKILIGEPPVFVETGDVIINQCAGIRDNNQAWIFEGDIVSIESKDALIYHLPVVFMAGCFGMLRHHEFIPFFDAKTRLRAETIVIIGNVYENVDLLNMRDPFLNDLKGKPN